MTDVLLRHTADGGEIDIVNGQHAMSDGLFNAVFLSLFGGNEDDSGLQGDDPKQFWGNLSETNPARKYRSETQYMLRSIPAIPANLRRIEDAVGRDLAWMTTALGASVSARATIPALNTVRIAVHIEIDGKRHSFDFTQGWGNR